MKNISFFLTQKQFKDGSKDVTRRLGWKNVKPGELLQGVVKGQGIPKGETIQKLGVIRVKSVRRERLDRMNTETVYGFKELEREGFSHLRWPSSFVTMFCDHNSCEPSQEVTRIEFEHV